LGDAHKLSDFTLPAGTFKRFELEQVVRLMLDLLAGLGALHEVVTDGEAFVHGEVSPRHVYVDEHGTARLVPLLNVHSAPAPPQHSGYAAPERLLGSVPDARVDTFSVGVMLWEALAGERLFPQPSPAAVLARQVPPIRLNGRTAWAQPLCAVAERAIAFEPNARFQTAHELAHAIATAAAPQLSLVEHESWQEEAPTPVFHPRLHLVSLRASTPPPAVTDVAPPSVNTAPNTVSPTVCGEPEEGEPRRAGRRVPVAVAVAALVLGLGAHAWLQAPRDWYEPTHGRTLEPAAATQPASVPSNDVVVVAPSVARPNEGSAPSVEVEARAASATSSSPPVTLRPSKLQGAVPPLARPKAGPRAKAADYGI
jgi:serine/threonine protein kinase